MSNQPSAGQIIANMPTGSFVTLQKIVPTGALQVRRQSNGTVALFWRYTFDGRSERVPIGLYDSLASPKALQGTERGYSVAAAIRAAEQLAVQHRNHRSLGGRPALLAERNLEEQRRIADAAAASEFTLGKLLNAYVSYLEALGRPSFTDVRSIFKVHVFESWPEFIALPSADVTVEQIADVIRRTHESGKRRTANKLRSYLRAAYQVAKSSRTKASVPAIFKMFKVTHNPVADTDANDDGNRADKFPLSEEELRIYWQNIKHAPGMRGAVLRLHLLTGAQRIAQFVRLKASDSNYESIKIFDPKGRPGKPPREHLLPLIPDANAALVSLNATGVYVMSSDGGQTHLYASTLSGWAVDAAIGIESFLAKRLRSGVETLLSRKGETSEVRGQLQSHGISGVQNRHYDANDFLIEKRRALETLYRSLES